jgi:hypothetical protein
VACAAPGLCTHRYGTAASFPGAYRRRVIAAHSCRRGQLCRLAGRADQQ